uniref:Coat protein n=3 Tax=Haploviricotina TaxID=2497570 RepID=Q592B0_9VIRU|nr:coat protein [Mirafiori lettuce big-vein virus]AAW82345.1 coat protein [Mirafiori lettuce big-vein virus]AAW82347.1 coat protein [Mirafiori lettuce big-vein virus]AAW82348.1 coat protein [Mirafiori lettuce big-vein virus]
MSGVYKVSEIQSILQKDVTSESETAILISLGLMTKEEKPVPAKMAMVASAKANSIVFVSEDGSLSFEVPKETGETSKTGEKKEEKKIEVGVKFPFSATKVKELIEGKSLTLDQDKIQKVLEEYVKNLPRTAETYKPKEIEIKYFKGVEFSVSSLLSSGTKILDAILYSTYKDSAEHNFIFDVKVLSPDFIDSKILVNNIETGNRAIKSAFCLVYNQGGLPSKTSEERPLSKFVRETIFREKDLKANELCDHLSSADPSLFPSQVFLKISLENLPTEVSSRCKMSIAGNKAMRYALLAQKFDKDEVPVPTEVNPTTSSEYMQRKEKVEKAKKIVDVLCSLASDFQAQVKMHPLSPERSSRKNFTLQLTSAIVTSLSYKGRLDMRKAIEEKKIEAFKRDENIFGRLNALGQPTFPVLTNADADFSELSVEAVKTAYGKK